MIKLSTKKIEFVFLAIFLLTNTWAFSQSIWTELAPMPMKITNNAVTQAVVNDTIYVYSFGGIDTTKHHSGISTVAMRYNTIDDSWSYMPPLPDSLGKIASAASTIGNKIYITGGYHVFESSPFELSSDKIHRYDPLTNSYLSDGSPIPHPIDDHVQAVWRDSLLFIITGWSDTGNVPFVQIYNPLNDSWQEGSSTPNSSAFKTFGASGVIIDDVIYYNGGAAGSSFSATNKMRRGVINPDDPTDITWDLLEENPGDDGYRMAAVNVGGQAFWIGGSGISYNYDGIAYNGSGGVPPLTRILSYNTLSDTWYQELNQPYGVMDLRGVAQIGENTFVICGGMSGGQQVSNKVYRIQLDLTLGIEDVLSRDHELHVFPNPVVIGQDVFIPTENFKNVNIIRFEIHNSMSQLVKHNVMSMQNERINISTEDLQEGVYYISVYSKNGRVFTSTLVINK